MSPITVVFFPSSSAVVKASFIIPRPPAYRLGNPKVLGTKLASDTFRVRIASTVVQPFSTSIPFEISKPYLLLR